MAGGFLAMPGMCRLLFPLPRLRTIRCFDPRKGPQDDRRAGEGKWSHRGNQEDGQRSFLIDSTGHHDGGITVEYELPKKALEALSEGDRSKAIDQVQMERNISREEAREMVAAFILSQPSLQATMRLKESRAETQWGLMRWLILFQAIAVAIGYFLFFRDQW